MLSQLTVMAVDRHEDHYDVQFRDADAFDGLEASDWARELAEAEVPGSDVRMGQDETDEWLVQTVRVPATLVDSADDASRKALQVVTVVSEHEALGSE